MLFNDYYLFILAGEHYETKTEHSARRLHCFSRWLVFDNRNGLQCCKN